jgi:hypothetical protein
MRRFCRWLISRPVTLALWTKFFRWVCAGMGSQLDIVSGFVPAESPVRVPEYVEADPRINCAVVFAALDDTRKAAAERPDHLQAELNACLECIRHPNIGNTFVVMLGSLQVRYDPYEAMWRVLANVLQLGMRIQTRLGDSE